MKKMLLTLAVLAMLVGCRSQKKVVKTEIATADTCSVSSASTTLPIARQRSVRRFAPHSTGKGHASITGIANISWVE